MTERLETPAELLAAAQQVALGADPQHAFDAALARANVGMKSAEALAGVLVVSSEQHEPALPDELFRASPLKYGIVVTHFRQAPFGWASPIAFVWFYSDRRSERQAFCRSCRREERQSSATIDAHL